MQSLLDLLLCLLTSKSEEVEEIAGDHRGGDSRGGDSGVGTDGNPLRRM
ncbi:MAG TPA: hypothetical protein VFI70_07585 [Nitrososphaeraceae archaeon]|nr:hypothetical protein [Nitrososphaeraceae archaeon]